ncbi:MAG: twin-arginine translocation signal domain-containing protein [Actinomycetota bacterium]|nr:twin-arginine translocation signal domain-containing protein [Actinomycetota bacterium]
MPPTMHGSLSRRRFLGLAGAASGAIALGACGSGASGSSEFDDVGSMIGMFPPDGTTLRTGIPQRTPFLLSDAQGAFMRTVPETLEITVTHLDEATGFTVEAVAHGDGIPIPYYPVTFTPERAGNYRAVARVGGRELEHNFMISDPQNVALVQPGEAAIPVETPTIDDHRGVDPICTRDEQCPFHEVTLAEALTLGKPTVLLIATPGYCQTTACAPATDLLVDQLAGRNDLAVVHAEVYVDPEGADGVGFGEATEVLSKYRMDFEPSLYTFDASGITRARLDYVMDGAEMREAIELAIAGTG